MFYSTASKFLFQRISLAYCLTTLVTRNISYVKTSKCDGHSKVRRSLSYIDALHQSAISGTQSLMVHPGSVTFMTSRYDEVIGN